MKVKITRGELLECIQNAVSKAISEGCAEGCAEGDDYRHTSNTKIRGNRKKKMRSSDEDKKDLKNVNWEDVARKEKEELSMTAESRRRRRTL